MKTTGEHGKCNGHEGTFDKSNNNSKICFQQIRTKQEAAEKTSHGSKQKKTASVRPVYTKTTRTPASIYTSLTWKICLNKIVEMLIKKFITFPLWALLYGKWLRKQNIPRCFRHTFFFFPLDSLCQRRAMWFVYVHRHTDREFIRPVHAFLTLQNFFTLSYYCYHMPVFIHAGV